MMTWPSNEYDKSDAEPAKAGSVERLVSHLNAAMDEAKSMRDALPPKSKGGPLRDRHFVALTNVMWHVSMCKLYAASCDARTEPRHTTED